MLDELRDGFGIWIALSMYLLVHLLAYVFFFRYMRALHTERGILLYHLISAAIVVIVTTASFLVAPTLEQFALIVGVVAAHGIYSLSFLEVWVLSEGGYSLRVLAEIVRINGTTPASLEQHFAALSVRKKAGRLNSLTGLGLVERNGSFFRLTVKGRHVANVVAFFARFTRGEAS
jgi:hypothetical protein